MINSSLRTMQEGGQGARSDDRLRNDALVLTSEAQLVGFCTTSYLQ